ncbi:MAG: phosphoenolpyruvate synthase [Candidatus Aenigmatarchaeota archaeon]
MEYIKWFDQVGKDDVLLVGGKGANLGEMTKLKIPVPFGFIITAKAFDKFLDVTKIREPIEKFIAATDVDNTEQLLNTSKKIKELILSQEIPFTIKNEILEAYRNLSISDKIMDVRALELISAGRDLALVAVRSSATTEDLLEASFAGQQASFLNVKGFKELLNAVKKCWASLYEPRAIFYRTKHGFTKASIAVVVQRMVNSEKSGVMFTIDPVTGEDVTVIEATWGLGETLVSGEVEPDMYKVSKDGKIVEKKIGKKDIMRSRDYATDRTVEIPVPKDKINAQVLTDDEILRLANYGKILEEHYNHPQDIEFAIEMGRIAIVQTRAVTTKAKVEEIAIKAKPILQGLAASPGIAKGIVRIVYDIKDITKVMPGDILVTTMTSPDLVPTMGKSSAIITDLGGSTSHAAIVSREMGIPCIVGTKEATKILKDGMFITVDAYHGFIYEGDVTISNPEEKIEEEIKPPEGISTVTQVKVNLAFPEKLEKIVKKADGVGLLRIEHMIVNFGVHPAKLIREGKAEDYKKILLEGIKPIAKAFYPKPIWVRTLDARSDEFRNLKGGEEEPYESNPMLGWHGIRRSLDEPEILKAELEAIKALHEEGLTNVHVMLPFIISVDEFRKAREISNEILLPDTVKMGIMIETPAAALEIESFCKEGIDFVSFGTNDLTQLVLGVDRNNERIAKLFSETHPAVLKLLKYVIKVCNRYNIETSICGEAGSSPEMVRYLVKNGIKSVSCNIDALDKIRKVVLETEREMIREMKNYL